MADKKLSVTASQINEIVNKADRSEVDGQWVKKYVILCETIKPIGNYPLSLADYLPDTNNTYEVRAELFVSDDHTTSAGNAWTSIGTSANPMQQRQKKIDFTTNGYIATCTDTHADKIINTGTLVFEPNQRTLYLEITNRDLETGASVAVYGYRRIGTNL